MRERQPKSLMRTRLIQNFIWHEGEVGTVFVGPEGIGKSTLIDQIRQTAGDAANFVAVGADDEPALAEGTPPLFVYLDPADSCTEAQLARLIAQAADRTHYLVVTFQSDPPVVIQKALHEGLFRAIEPESFRLDEKERATHPVLAAEIDRRLDRGR